MWLSLNNREKINNEIIANFSIVYRIFFEEPRGVKNEGKQGKRRIFLHFLRGGDAEDTQTAGDDISQAIQQQ